MVLKSRGTMNERRSVGTLPFALVASLTAFAEAACGNGDDASPTRAVADASTDASTLLPDASGAGALPTVTGPITGGSMGKPFTAAPIDLASFGYVEEEYFIEGNATAYAFQGTAGDDGMWSVKPTTTAHYKTRMLVRHPSDKAKFNGTVLVEWLNVSGGVDDDPEFSFGHVELLRSGFAYVGVSAQAQGVIGGGFSLGTGGVPLVQWDPQRYGSLQHPGDNYSYDMFTQATEVLRHPGPVNPLGALTPAHLIGDGESQSAFRLVTYIDAIAPLRNLFDGFFVHSRSGGAAELVVAGGGKTANILGGPSVANIRADLTVPVFQFETETDVLGIEGLTPFFSIRQPDSDRLRSWEVAGTSHADEYLLDYAAQGMPGADAGSLGCTDVNRGPQHWVVDTALHEMNSWVTGGAQPAKGAPLTLADAGSGLAKDAEGNSLGGVRTAAVDVPIATYSGQSTSSNVLCSLFGSTTPLSPAQLLALYPTHDDYVSKVTAATSAAQQAGFILAADAPLVVQEAQAAPIPQ